MKLADYLGAQRGRVAKVARKARIAPAFLSQMAAGRRPVTAVHVPSIEEATDYQVRRWEMRPDDWHRIWPELIGTEGAPAVVVAEAA